jgi:membrane-bound lytic murein transglycosylase A
MRGTAVAATLLLSFYPMLDLKAEPARNASLEPLTFSRLAGWGEDDHAAAFAVFRRSCEAILEETPALRAASAPDADLRRVCEAAVREDAGPSREAARRFFEAHFTPMVVQSQSGRGFLTGYFEPEYEGSLTESPDFPAPLLARPDDLVSVPPGEMLPGLDSALQAARRTDTGWSPYPDRAAIETGALGDHAKPIAFVRDAVAAFVIQVQGSARLRLPDGRTLRVAYAGRNGLPYTSIGRILVEEGRIPLEDMSLERLTGWLRAHPDEGRAVMRRNRSFVFFRIADELAPADGPIGGAGLPLTPGRSLAVDRSPWSYGLPFWLDGALPLPGGGEEPLRRLMVAQDTGTAIVGPARGDYFFGSGAEAGTRAGLLRHPTRFVVLLPKPP